MKGDSGTKRQKRDTGRRKTNERQRKTYTRADKERQLKGDNGHKGRHRTTYDGTERQQSVQAGPGCIGDEHFTA